MTVAVVGGGEGGAPGDFDFVGEIGEDFRVAAKLQIERFFYGDWAAPIAALVPGAKRIEKQRVEFTLSIRFEQKNAGKRRENTRS